MTEKPEKIRTSAQSVAGKGSLDLFRSTPIEVQSTHTAELVIALCGPIGGPLHVVAKILKRLLVEQFAYECEIIRLSEIIEKRAGDVPNAPRFERIKSLIEKGNDIRREHGSCVLADLAIAKIAKHRERYKGAKGSRKYEPRRVCHILDSIKNQEELEALRLVYRDMLYFIGVFSPMPLRERSLEQQGMSLAQVYQLIDRDSGEEIEHGQTVRNTFPHADFFLRIDSDNEKPAEEKLKRFLNIIFATEVITPTAAETAMHAAASAGGNSACLSRQVGAAITDSKGELLAVGWNDVPKFGGGLYQFHPDTDPRHDHRCMHRGEGTCSNDMKKDELSRDIAKELAEAEVINPNDVAKVGTIIRKSKIKDLIEFSRSVHAEMHAIILGSQLAGSRVRGGKLFCTTYPCHSCARHIILSGISEVYYIEPYRKSLATRLHDDAITEIESETDKVRILPFDGVAPERYLDLFRMNGDSRKLGSSGVMKTTNKKTAVPKCAVTLESLPALEALVVQRLINNHVIPVERLQLTDDAGENPNENA